MTTTRTLAASTSLSAAVDAALAAHTPAQLRAVGIAPAPALTSAPALLRTSANLSNFMAPDSGTPFAPVVNMPGSSAIYVDSGDLHQNWFGAGVALTETSCFLLTTRYTPAQRRALLQQAFGTDGLTTARICMGSPDFTPRGVAGVWPTGAFYTYADNDSAADPSLPYFSIQNDLEYIVPVIQEVLAINPQVKIMACPWSPPAWMKTTNSLLGGGNFFNPGVNNINYTAYANYFLKFLQAYKALGIPVWAVSVQNEPHFGPATYPGCIWSGVQMAAFIGQYLGPTLSSGGFGTVRILTGEMNWLQTTGYGGSNGDLVLNCYQDGLAMPYTSGSAWHGYDAPINASHPVVTGYEHEDQRRKSWPGKEIHFTELTAGVTQGLFATDGVTEGEMNIMFGNLAVGAVRAGANSVTLWNLVLDPSGQPARGSGCRGALTVTDTNGTTVKNAGYAMLASLAKAGRPGARRCRSTTFAAGMFGQDVQSVAFLNTDGSVGVVLWNGSAATKAVSLIDSGSGLVSFLTLAPGEATCASYTASKALAAQAAGTNTAPGPVTNLQLSSANGVGSLTWTPPSNLGTGGLGGILIRRGSTSGGETQTVGVARAGDVSFTDYDVAQQSTYFWTVIPFGAGGLAAGNPEVSGKVTPSAPSAAAISATPFYTGGRVDISLVGPPPASNGGAVTSVSVYRGTSANGEGATAYQTGIAAPTAANALIFSDTAATNGTQFFYFVTFTNGVGEGARSNEVNATAQAPADQGGGLLYGNDVGANIQTTQNAVPTAGWSPKSFTFAPGSVVVSNHQTVVDPAGNATGSTFAFSQTGGTSGFASIECATSGNIGTASHTYTIWLRGKTGGEKLQLLIGDSTRANGQTITLPALTTSWQRFSYQVSISTGATKLAIMNLGLLNPYNGTVTFDACWPNIT